ncbi:MAG TPA: nitroreductase/quinone reductase family protein [Candidatus Limnocylindrales bacterium]|jgi:deazaflavin-dependent oxidoreductase (nitroreductase family)|nr:nitroreductase/quinone reductase family protein [Candidatus Limnocylindrales bacterium]
MTDWDPEAFTRDLIADMRAHDGVPSQGMFAGRKLLILTTTGAKTGQPRTAVLAYRPEGDAWVIAGSKGGSDEHPAWISNLVATAGDAEIEVNNERVPVKATIAADGPERDRLWDAHVEEMPGFGEYPKKTDRVIPMVVLKRAA